VISFPRAKLKENYLLLTTDHFYRQICEHILIPNLFILFLQDSVTLLAEIVTSCTKATVPASEVWEKLLHRGDKMISGNGCT